MGNTSRNEHPRPRSRVKATVLGFVAAVITGGAVSLSTPDGNLVVTLVPALAVGLVVFGAASRRIRR